MPDFSDAQLRQRGLATSIASWEAYARGAPGAVVMHASGVIAAVFPHEPERAVYNNALLGSGLSAAERAAALDTMDAAYANAGVQHYAAWVDERDADLRADLEQRGYTIAETTRMMGMVLDDLPLPLPAVAASALSWDEYLHQFGLPPGFLAGADHARFHAQAVRHDGEAVAAALAFDHDGDCGIFNVETLEHARRRGLATALTLQQVHAARARGCQTASLQATPEAERVYAAVGFRDLGRILEYVPHRNQ